jgi:hypothetical protein
MIGGAHFIEDVVGLRHDRRGVDQVPGFNCHGAGEEEVA